MKTAQITCEMAYTEPESWNKAYLQVNFQLTHYFCQLEEIIVKARPKCLEQFH